MSEKNKYIEVFPEFEEVTAFFATKEGASDGWPYDREDVFAENWLEEAVPVRPKQIHEDHIELIEQRPYRPLDLPDTDGMITNLRGVLLTTVHADCLPVYFFDPFKNAIGLVHAGWRGIEKQIAAKAVVSMNHAFGTMPEDVFAYIGPGIGRCCFEVGPEVYEKFSESCAFIDEFSDKKGEKYYIDLKGINRRQLEELGVPAAGIKVSDRCTCCEPETFCSYRREGGTYRRMGAGICLI